MTESGTLYVVATPIGNLGDLSPRALATLESVDLILAEDTRVFGKLAKHFELKTPFQSYHDHNERQRAATAIEQLKAGQSLALVSDAGTPTIADPGYRIVSACHEAEIPVVSIAGPSAAIAALSISGFEIERFAFEGFLPQKGAKKTRVLEAALESDTTTVFYESPHRIVKTIAIIAELQPERDILVARELTKMHEEVLRGPAKEVGAELGGRTKVRGEIVLVIRAKR